MDSEYMMDSFNSDDEGKLIIKMEEDSDMDSSGNKDDLINNSNSGLDLSHDHTSKTVSMDYSLTTERASKPDEKPQHLNQRIRKESSHEVGEKPYRCSLCDKRFTYRNNLSRHMVVHQESPKYKCFVCPETFRDKVSLNKHLLSHQNGDYRCVKCQRGFTSKRGYALHMKEHILEKQSVEGDEMSAPVYECEICQRTYMLKSSLNRHMKKHLFEKNYPNVMHSDDEVVDSHKDLDSSDILSDDHILSEGQRTPFCSPRICTKPPDSRATTPELLNSPYSNAGVKSRKKQFYSPVAMIKKEVPNDGYEKSGNLGKADYSQYMAFLSSSVMPNSANAEHLHADNTKYPRQNPPSSNGEMYSKAIGMESESSKSNYSSVDFNNDDNVGLDLSMNSTQHQDSIKKSFANTDQSAEFVISSDGALDLSMKTTSKYSKEHSTDSKRNCATSDISVKRFKTDIIENIDGDAVDLSTKSNAGVFQIDMESNIQKDAWDMKSPFGNQEYIVLENNAEKQMGSEQEIHKCKKCELTFHDRLLLLKHKKEQHDILESDVDNRQCPFCPESFHSKSELNKHLLHHLKDLTYFCEHCCVMFCDKDKYLSHQNSHDENSFYKCNLCPETHMDKSAQLKHLKTHVGEKPFLCFECGQAFPVKSYLESHMRKHIVTKPFQCKICNKGFSHSFNLTKHVRTHTGEKPYECSRCSRKFGQKNSLNRHLQLQTCMSESLYPCQVCGKCFSDQMSVLDHQEKDHSNVSTDRADPSFHGQDERSFKANFHAADTHVAADSVVRQNALNHGIDATISRDTTNAEIIPHKFPETEHSIRESAENGYNMVSYDIPREHSDVNNLYCGKSTTKESQMIEHGRGRIDSMPCGNALPLKQEDTSNECYHNGKNEAEEMYFMDGKMKESGKYLMDVKSEMDCSQYSLNGKKDADNEYPIDRQNQTMKENVIDRKPGQLFSHSVNDIVKSPNETAGSVRDECSTPGQRTDALSNESPEIDVDGLSDEDDVESNSGQISKHVSPTNNQSNTGDPTTPKTQDTPSPSSVPHPFQYPNPYMAQALMQQQGMPYGGLPMPYGGAPMGYPGMMMPPAYMMNYMMAYQLAVQQQKLVKDSVVPGEMQQQASVLMNYMQSKQGEYQEQEKGAADVFQEQASSFMKRNVNDRNYVNSETPSRGKGNSEKKNFQCTECGRKFKRSNYLRVHMRVHTGERPFQCQICQKRFSHSFNLTKHMRTHTGEQPYNCSICDRRFSHINSLNRHLALHAAQPDGTVIDAEHKETDLVVGQNTGVQGERKIVQEAEGEGNELNNCNRTPDFVPQVSDLVIRKAVSSEIPHYRASLKMEANGVIDQKQQSLPNDNVTMVTAPVRGDQRSTVENTRDIMDDRTITEYKMRNVYNSNESSETWQPSYMPHNVSEQNMVFNYNSESSNSSVDSQCRMTLIHPKTVEGFFDCPKCHMKYDSEDKLKTHWKVQHAKQMYTCEFCNASFGRKITLLKHRRVHLKQLMSPKEEPNMSFNEQAPENANSSTLTPEAIVENMSVSCNYVSSIGNELGNLNSDSVHDVMEDSDKNPVNKRALTVLTIKQEAGENIQEDHARTSPSAMKIARHQMQTSILSS